MRFDIEIDDRQAVRALAELRRRGESMEPAVYPRVCGGTEDISDQGNRAKGLSPRVRGNRCR